MSEGSENKSFATASSGKSPEEVAFELLNKLKGQGVWGERNISAILDMYAECLDAAKGLRAYEGQNRVDVQIKGNGAQAASAKAETPAPVQARVAAQPAPAQPAPTPPQAAPAQPSLSQPLVQQQVLQQAYKQS